MPNLKIQNLFGNPRTNWGYIWIVVIVGAVSGAGILLYYQWWVATL